MPKPFGYLIMIVLVTAVAYGLWIQFGPWLIAPLVLLLLASAAPLVAESVTNEREHRARRRQRQEDERAALAKRTAELEARLGIGDSGERPLARCPVCGQQRSIARCPTCGYKWEP
jgi:hypothetical protein